jgi:hypothetical protein
VTWVEHIQDSTPRGPVYDAVKGQRVKDAAYAEMVNELTTAWEHKPQGSSHVFLIGEFTEAELPLAQSPLGTVLC